MLPNEILLEITAYSNKNDLARFIFTNKNIYQMLSITETIIFYKNNGKNMLEISMHYLFIFKTIYYSETLPNKGALLRHASEKGYLEVVKFLVTDGADLTTWNNYAVRVASEKGFLEIVVVLFKNGADLTTVNNFAIRWASENGHLNVVKFLVENGADLNAVHNHAVYWAKKSGHLEVVKFLLENGADLTAWENA